MMKRKIYSFFAAFLLAPLIMVPASFAAEPCTTGPQFSVLPATSKSYEECRDYMISLDAMDQTKLTNELKTCRSDVLGCGIKTGKIGFWMIPYFITYITNFLLSLAGLICVMFIVLGGYRYVIGGLTDEKEKGKGTIKDALLGMGVALLAWTVVNVLIQAVTG